MRKLILIALLLVLAGAATAAYLLRRGSGPEWTSRSPEALEEVVAGFEDLSKIYVLDAIGHFERALELDGELAVAKLQLARLFPSESPERQRLLDELKAADLGVLNPRERFLVSYGLAGFESKDDEAARILDAYLAEQPEDPYAINARCGTFWEAQQWDAAEPCYARLLELHPNQVAAQNRLGYIAMARGRFSEAEEHFLTYRYLAPDQANPHDSLAELLTLLGRYDEAERALDEAIRIKPDFCHAYIVQVRIHHARGRFEAAEDVLRRLEALDGCELLKEEGYLCSMRALGRYFGADSEGAWEMMEGGCLERRKGFDLLGHRIAVMTGRLDRSAEMEEIARQRQEKMVAEGRPVYADFYAAILAHMEGIRSLAAGDFAQAAERLSEVDRLQGYWGGDRASFKLFNRLNLLRALELSGAAAQAKSLRGKIELVNPRLIDELRLSDLEAL